MGFHSLSGHVCPCEDSDQCVHPHSLIRVSKFPMSVDDLFQSFETTVYLESCIILFTPECLEWTLQCSNLDKSIVTHKDIRQK